MSPSAPGLPPTALRPSMRLFARWAFSPNVDWRTSRKRLELGTKVPPPPRGTDVRPGTLGGVPMEDLRPPGADPSKVVLYLHGGGYTTGSPATHRGMAARFAQGAGARACVLDYRMAPEHPFPAPIEDVRAAYEALLAEGVEPGRIAIAGDSAGGGLAVAVAVALRDAGRPLPAVLGLISPWLDHVPDRDGTRPEAPQEPILSRGVLRRFSRAYLAGHDAADPLASPLRADLAGLPPVVVHTGEDDLLAPDAFAFEPLVRAAGGEVEHVSHAGVWHVFHLNAPLMGGPLREAPQRFGEALGRRLSAA